ncbi:hypothetical protein D3C77_777520 [compost metagenome]
MLMLADVVQRGGVAEARHVFIAFAHLPGMEGGGHLPDVIHREVAQHAIFHVAQLASVDK